MGTYIHIINALEPIEVEMPLEACMHTVNAAMKDNFRFFFTQDKDGQNVAISLDKITKLTPAD